MHAHCGMDSRARATSCRTRRVGHLEDHGGARVQIKHRAGLTRSHQQHRLLASSAAAGATGSGSLPQQSAPSQFAAGTAKTEIYDIFTDDEGDDESLAEPECEADCPDPGLGAVLRDCRGYPKGGATKNSIAKCEENVLVTESE